MADDGHVGVTLELQDGYRFLVDLDHDGVAPLVMDEPEPLGTGCGASASRLLAAAVGNCLSASALYCLRRARIDGYGMQTTVDASLKRNEAGRLRVKDVRVRIKPVIEESQQARMQRCLELFEDFCVVTQSVRQGIDVDVAVEPISAEVEA
jgi:organic hydroperoxide reductase OsmC/OhrA